MGGLEFRLWKLKGLLYYNYSFFSKFTLAKANTPPQAVASLNIQTPYGAPSSPLTILKTPQNTPIAFLSRHGLHHELNPTEVPNRANIAALRSIGVRSIIAFSAVGSLQEYIRPRDFVIPSQIIDRTKGIRASTFFEGGLVGHVSFGDPFDTELAKAVFDIGSDGVLKGEGVKMHKDGLLICMGMVPPETVGWNGRVLTAEGK